MVHPYNAFVNQNTTIRVILEPILKMEHKVNENSKSMNAIFLLYRGGGGELISIILAMECLDDY